MDMEEAGCYILQRRSIFLFGAFLELQYIGVFCNILLCFVFVMMGVGFYGGYASIYLVGAMGGEE